MAMIQSPTIRHFGMISAQIPSRFAMPFFNTRAELLAEGFPKLAGEWNEKHGLKSTGHPPGNYDPTPIDMNADIFKFYRHTQVPLTDAIIRYQFGQDGHKLISSAADYYDRPVVSTEIYGAYRENIFRFPDALPPHDGAFCPRRQFCDSSRHVVQSGARMPYTFHPWFRHTAKRSHLHLPAYSEFVGRSCMLLQGGSRVAEIGDHLSF
jgi:hypothetical protein